MANPPRKRLQFSLGWMLGAIAIASVYFASLRSLGFIGIVTATGAAIGSMIGLSQGIRGAAAGFLMGVVFIWVALVAVMTCAALVLGVIAALSGGRG